ALRVLHLFGESPAVEALDAIVDEGGVGELRHEVVEALRVDGLQDGPQRLLGRPLRVGIEVGLDAVSWGRGPRGRCAVTALARNAGQREEPEKQREADTHDAISIGCEGGNTSLLCCV